MDATEEKTQWFVMTAYKSEQKAEEKLRGEGGLEYFIPKQYRFWKNLCNIYYDIYVEVITFCSLKSKIRQVYY